MSLEERVEKLVVKHGGLRRAALALGINCAYLCRLRSGEKTQPSEGTLRRLGLRRVVSYKTLEGS